MKPKIRVLIADDHAILRTGLVALLDCEPDIEIVGEAADGAEAVRKAVELRPDVVVMDLLMPVLDGVGAIREIRRRQCASPILVLTTSTVSNDLASALSAGATGALPKSTANERIVAAIRDVAAGKTVVDREISKMIAQDPPVEELTDRQLEVLHSLTRGLSNTEIARQFGIAEITVKNHVSSILARLGAANRSEAVAIALRKQLLKV